MSDIINTEPGYYALAQPGGNITALEINQEINLFGSHVNLVGTTFDTYPPIQDAPVEKKIEKEEGSWLGNLLTGIVVTAAFAGLAIATVATGGAALAAVALAGAAVGTGVVTAAVSYSDAKSGHARTWTQFLGNLAMGGAIGATTAASIYGLWTVLPAASQAAGLQVSLWTGTTSSMTVSTIPTIATYGGYGLMGANGAFALNEIASIGTGQNWMLDHVFGGNQEAYDGAALITGMCTMGYMEVGANNAALGGRTSSKKDGVQFEVKDNIELSEQEIATLKKAVLDEGQALKDMGLTNSELGPAIAGAYVKSNGKIYTAINDVNGLPPSELSPILEQRINNMPKEVLDSYTYTKGAGSHAEIYAVNKALLDNPGVGIDDIVVYVNRTLGASKPMKEVPFETCPHCRYILDGFNIISNK